MFKEVTHSPFVIFLLFSFMFGSFVCERVTRQSSAENDILSTGAIRETSARLGELIAPLTAVPTELVFVLDATQSVRVKRFERFVKVFVKDFSSLFPLRSNQTRVAVILFASCQKVRTEINFINDGASPDDDDDDFSTCTLFEALDGMGFIGGQGSCLGKGLVEAEGILASARPGAERLLVLFTDGRPRGADSPTEAAQRVRQDGTTVVAFGVGKGANKELVSIATQDHALSLDTWEDLGPLGAILAEGKSVPNPSILGAKENHCHSLCTSPVNDRCCDAHARCTCYTDTGRYRCVCPPGYTGDGLSGNCSIAVIPEAVEQSCIAPGSPANGQAVCDNQTYSVDSTCTFICDDGFELGNNGPIICQITGDGEAMWTGLTPTCEEVANCPVLEARPNMILMPPACNERLMNPGEECRYRCNDGFRMDGDALWVCQEDRAWLNEGSAPMTCIDLSPPQWLNCPNGTVVSTDHRRPTAMATWTVPQATDQSGGELTIVSTAEPPVYLRVGVTEVRYTAIDETGLHAECSFIVEVIDEEPPILLTCPTHITELAGTQTRRVSWNAPRFKDNTEVISIETNSQADSILTSLDAQEEVWYRARDEAGHETYCNFTVSLKPYKCPYMEPPLHGALLCESWLDGGAICAISCQEGYDFNRSPATFYVCSQSSSGAGTYEWQMLDVNTVSLETMEAPWPQCYKKVGADNAPSRKSIRYFESPCNTTEAKTTLRKKFLKLFKKLDKEVPGFCRDGCEEAGVLVSCGMEDVEDVGQGGGTGNGDRLRREVNVDDILGLLAKRPVFSLESSLPVDVLISHLREVLLKDFDGKLKMSLGPSFETRSSDGKTVPGFACDEGYVKQGSVCLRCPVGTYHMAGAEMCVWCEYGTFQNESGQTACKACPESTNTTGRGARSRGQCLEPCLVGTNSRTGLQPCLACSVGTFQSREGATSCEQCPDDAMMQIEGALSLEECMSPCNAGSFSMSGYRPCIPCAPGSYQPMRSQQACLLCPDGLSSAVLGASDITSCVELTTCYEKPCQNNGACVARSDVHVYCMCVTGFTGTSCETNIDNCSGGPCMHGGTCQDEVAGYRCDCPPGFNGVDCEVDVDECQSGPCVNGAACIDGVNSFTCDCPDGFTGTICADSLDFCSPNPCRNDAICVNGGTDYRCQCLAGFHGRDCEVDIDDCQQAFCDNGGTCIDGVDVYWCRCADGFAGSDCEVNINDCYINPCQNGGRCVDGVDEFRCECAAGFTGVQCDIDIDDCVGVQCINNGQCVDVVSGFYCECQIGFSGQFCQIDVNDCHDEACKNGGTCQDGINTFHCICADGFTGNRCTIDIDDCAGNPCMNAGQCIDSIDSFTCICARGFTGPLCETNIDNCIRTPCRNGGSCIDDIDSFRCDCITGYTGRLCEFNIDDCWSRPCLNRGRCKDGINSYRCHCLRGHTGANCELEVDDCERNSCRNGATCTDGVNTYTCLCVEGFSGRYCQIKPDFCAFIPCLNNGVCQDLETGYKCTCPSNFRGPNCETIVPPCENHNCTNGGTCEDHPEGPARCVCADGFVGNHCETSLDYCASSPCDNGAACVNDVLDYLCECRAGFSGRNCQVDIDECQSGPCQHNATCQDQVNAYTCECTDDHSGINCQVVVSPCDSSPCLNGGTCGQDPTTSFRCFCLPGYRGRLCETRVDACQAYLCRNGGSCQDLSSGPVCVCKRGFTGQLCEVNIDDCINMPCKNGGSCKDRVNGYRCTCVEGFIGANCQINKDDCRSAPCENGATCVDGNDDYSCLCRLGFSGRDCEVNIDDCGDNPCRNGGLCVDVVNDFQCQCRPGFTGEVCDANIDDCLGVQCRNGGTCIDYVEDFFCQCVPGFTGALCDVDVDNCEDVQCGNGGTCWDGVDAFGCDCLAGFTGALCEVDIDVCLEEPCQNAAQCVDVVDGFTCQCLPGFTGDLCDVNIDECGSNPCLNQAQCVDVVDGFTCQCLPGFTGDLCDVNIDECGSNPCLNQAQCVDVVDGFTCQCLPGFTGDLCDVNIDECGSNPCLNQAQCVDVVDGFTCQCLPGFTGDLCDVNIDECGSNPCLNQAQCVDVVDGFTCQCLPGFTGDLCDVNIDECVSNPCLNQAQCVDVVDGYWCLCKEGYEGVLCETNIDDCQTQACQNDATCTDLINSFSCECPAGFTGNLCQINIDDCSTSPCKNGGRCVDGINTFSCVCLRGFTGNLCQLNIDDCASRPCKNGGNCLDGINKYSCTCAAGFLGPRCETNINDCQPNPCENAGRCIDGLGTYTCQCFPGFSGRHCAVVLDDCFARPCRNGGRCVDGDRDYYCDCIPGFTGKDCEVDVDECASAPCINDGICHDDINSYMCECPDGFTGLTCEVNYDDCASSPCLNGAECQDLPRGFSCYCQDGYHGNRCQGWISPCDARPCDNDGQCILNNDNKSFHCQCRRGYQGAHCEDDVDDCLEHMEECLNGAVCEDRVDGFVCQCLPGYSGDNCQLRLSSDFDLIIGPSRTPAINAVNVQPDLHELTLSLWIRPEDMIQRGTLLSYVVYNGEDHQETVDHGVMREVLSLRDYSNMVVRINSDAAEMDSRHEREIDWHHVAFTWESESGAWHFYFDGTLHRQGTGLQTGRFIPGGGLLTVGKGHDGIVGEEGSAGSFVGRLSQVNMWQFPMSEAEILSLYGSCGRMGDAMTWPQILQDGPMMYRRQPSQICRRIDDCASSPCRNGATCCDWVHSYTCDCADGYEGYACQVVSASCMRDTCMNGGRCHDGLTGPVCRCVQGFTGPQCEDAANPCESVRCRNGGSCDLDNSNNPVCVCPAGYRGPRCSYDSRLCRQNGIIREANEEWEEGCMHCQCTDGISVCTPMICYDPICPKGQEAVNEPGFCCPVCSTDKISCSIDPYGNFQSFDLYSFHFHGNCRYTMAQDCSSGSFSVHLELEHKDSISTARSEASQKVIFIYLNGVRIELRSSGVSVDGSFVNLPFVSSQDGLIQIHRPDSELIKVTSNKGLDVLWRPSGEAEVSVPRSFRRQLCGLCGNMNGNTKDDGLTKQQLPSRTVREFTHSWKVNGYDHCTLPATVLEAATLPRILVGRLPACAGLTYHSWREVLAKCDILKQTMFAECREVVDPRSFYELCQQDACSCGGNEPCYCEAIAAYTQECRRNGIIVREWRNSTVCGIDCPETMIFDDCGPPCLETCFNTATLSEMRCRLPCVARCQCAAGMAFHEGQCIMKSTCPNLVGSTGG